MRAMRMRRSLLGAATAAMTICAGAGPALAQTSGLALDRFDPAPAGDRMFGVPSPYAAGDLTPHLMLLMDYAHNPLVIRTIPNNNNVGAVVKNQLYLNLDGGISLWSRLFIDVDLPVALLQTGDSPNIAAGGQTFAFSSPSSAQLGDLRIGARVRLWGEYWDPFQIAVGGYLWAPTGAKDSFVSTGAVRGLPQVIVGGRVQERWVYSAALGPEIQGNVTYAGVEQGTMFKWGAGVGLLLLDNRHLQVGPELSGDLTPRNVQKRTTNAELLIDVRYRVIDDLEIAAGLGPGLTSGIGTPDFRGILSVAYTPEQKRDRDHDGIPDDVDACPDVPGLPNADPAKNGCPEIPDRDHDGIPDDVDACPDVPGVPDPDPKKNGCPPPKPDRDHDGIPDDVDACPDVPGVADPDPAKNGCPPDRDGDKIIDAEDACPDVPGQPDEDPKKNGCPHKVQITEHEILILEQVQFDVDRSTIKKVSDGLLDEVAGVLKDHPEIKRIEVQGHTDNTGSAVHNKVLSGARADAVLKALTRRGIKPNRLTSKGFGQEKPIADNATDAGKQKNRRVQFTILELGPKGPAGGPPPPPPPPRPKAPPPPPKPKR
jgi:outer membrane protein OmpA-like peptidoglycan-associated protein